LIIFVGAGALVLALLLALASIRRSADIASFQAAGVCATPPSAPTRDCRSITAMTVSSIKRWEDRGGAYYDFQLTGAARPAAARVDSFFWSSPHFHPGQVIQATIWNGLVTTLEAGGQSFTTHNSPLYRAMEARRLAISLGALGVLLLASVVIYDQRQRRGGSREPGGNLPVDPELRP
jgi:hypothetical protein